MAEHTKTDKIVKRAFSEVKGEDFPGGEKQRIAVALSKSRARGARIPAPPKKRRMAGFGKRMSS